MEKGNSNYLIIRTTQLSLFVLINVVVDTNWTATVLASNCRYKTFYYETKKRRAKTEIY